MNLLGLTLWLALVSSGPVDAYLQHFFSNPKQNRASLDQALTLLQQKKEVQTFFDVVDSARKVIADARLFQRATLFAAKVGDSARVLYYGRLWMQQTPTPLQARGVYSQIYFRGYRSAADSILKLAIQRWGEEPFLREEYQKALWARDYEQALDVLMRELKIKKDVPYVLSEVRRLKKYLGASAFESALKQAGEFKEAHIVRAWLALDAGDWDLAVQEAQKSQDPNLMLDLADRLIQDRAYDLADRLLRILPKSAQNDTYFLLRARVARALGKHKEAETFYERAGESAHAEYLSYLLERQEFAKVLDLATQSQDLPYRVQALLALGRIDEARQLVSVQSDPHSQYLYALLELVRGKVQRADTLFQKFVNAFPRSTEADQALFHLEMIRSLRDTQALALYLRVQRALLTQHPDSALQWVESYAAKTPEDRSLRLYLLGQLNETLQRIDQALGYYHELGDQDSLFLGAFALYRAAKLEMEAVRDTQAALETLKTLIRRFPQSPYAAIARTYF